MNLVIADTGTSSVSTGSAEIDYPAMTWSYMIDTTTFVDGEKDITIEVLDTSATPKTDIIQRLLFFDNTAPMLRVTSYDGYTNLENVPNLISNSRTWITGEAYDTLKVKQVSVTLTGEAHDTEVIDKILISYNGGTSYTDITSSSAKINDTHYDISQSVNSVTYISDSGILPVKLKVIDNAGNSTDTAINLNIDNLQPSGSRTGIKDDVNGTSFLLQGTATDMGTVSDIDKIEVYFIRSGNEFRPNLSNTSIPVDTMDFNDGNRIVSYTTNPNYKIIIDDKNELGDDTGGNGDSDSYDESLTLSGSIFTWWAKFNSINISDGTLELHYVVFDKAGNAVHYSDSGFIKNNKPSITLAKVGVDLDYSSVVEEVEKFDYSRSFSSQNRLYLDFQVADYDFHGLNYSIYHGIDNTGTLLSSTSSVTIDISGYSDGSHNFFSEITDSDGITVTQLIETVIDNTDNTAPTINIDALSQSHVTDGHLETAGVSTHDNTPADDDVSGILTLTGNAWDNQRIKNIKLTLDGIGTDVILAAWVGNALVSQDGNFTIDSYSISEDSGLLITWSYVWDTSSVSNVAADNVTFSIALEDFGSPTNTGSEAITVDVVPYITNILRNPVTFNTIISKFGRNSIRRGETLNQLNGYNLRTGGGSDEFGVSILKTGAIDTIITSTGSTGSSQLLFTAPATLTSGWIRLVVNGVEAINNLNDNSQSYNQEYSVSNSASVYWSDDRSILAFNPGTGVGDYFDDFDGEAGDPQFAAMDIASDGTLYASWSTYSTSDVSYSTLSPGSVVDVWHGYDPPEFTDITVNGLNINVLYLANYNGGSGWDANSQTAGGLYLYDDNVPSVQSGRNPLDPTYRFELMYHNETLLQFRNIRVVRGSNDRIYTSYFDNVTGSIKFSSINDGYTYTVASGETNDEIPWINIDGGSDSHDIINGLGLVNQYDASLSRISSAGSYSAIVLDDDNYPLVVYYDGDNQTMRLARSDNTNPGAITNWTIQEVFDTGDVNFNFTGDYISAEVDGDGYLHIVSYKSSQGKIIYIKSTNNPESGAAYTFGRSVELDTSSGVWADLYIDDEGGTYRPYIAYLDSTGINSFDGLKLAYRDDSADINFDDVADGDWETVNVPLILSIKNERISLVTAGATGAAWTTAIGYKSGSHFYTAYLY